MNKLKKTYHHGHLRDTLLNAAAKMITSEGVLSLSMRKLADKVAVSRTAPYHHFKDKNELVCAIAEKGFAKQDILIESITHTHNSSALEQFKSFVLCYIRFAIQEKETYSLMYGSAIWRNGTPTDSLLIASKDSFKKWLKLIEKLQGEMLFDSEISTLRLAQSSWAALHGLCQLYNDGVYIDRDDIEEIAMNTVYLLINKPVQT